MTCYDNDWTRCRRDDGLNLDTTLTGERIWWPRGLVLPKLGAEKGGRRERVLFYDMIHKISIFTFPGLGGRGE
jgi:hypothetical protein